MGDLTLANGCANFSGVNKDFIVHLLIRVVAAVDYSSAVDYSNLFSGACQREHAF